MITPTRQSPRLTFMLLMRRGMEEGRRTLVRTAPFPPPRERTRRIRSGSVREKLVNRVMMEPNTATDTAEATMVLRLAPSHTMSRGARADFGRLLSIMR